MSIIKSLLRKIVPEFILGKLISILPKFKLYRTKKIFNKAPGKPVWLGRNELESLNQKYPLPSPYPYDSQSLENKGGERAEEILGMIPTKREKINTFLELGCWDGMVSCNLKRKGKQTTAIDNRIEGFDQRAINEGVALSQMDVTHLKFENESFDFVFSYDGFEHFDEPELVLQEAIRVVKQGGYIYCFFGPLFMSPAGLHIYNIISVPYCQFLFPKELIKDFVKIKKIKATQDGSYVVNGNLFPCETDDWVAQDPLNGWSVRKFRRLWSKYSNKLERIKYCEHVNISHLDLIAKYPSCFKSKTKYFDNLIVSSIEVLFIKR